MGGIPLVLILSILTLFQIPARVGAATVQIFASDTTRIQYSSGWVGPTIFQLEPDVDDPNLAGANSSVCSIPEVSMFSPTDGQSFSFSFHGVAVQLVLSSRPDHAPFGVSIDGGPEELRDSYSTGARCGVAWSREGLKLGNHTVRTTAHIAYPRIFLELLSIIYDDGSDTVVPPSAPPSLPSTPKLTSTPSSGPTSSASARPRTSTTTTPTSQSSLASSLSASAFESLSSESSSSSPPDTSSSKSSAVLPTASTRNTAARSPRVTLTRGAVIGIATSCAGLAALLGLMVLVLLWRRRRARRVTVGSYLHPYPTSTAGSGSSAAFVTVEKKRQSPAVHPSSGNCDVSPQPRDTPGTTTTTTPSRSSAPTLGTLTEPQAEALRLAPEDIDRIAARMHDVLTTARLGDSNATALLPPY